MKARNILVPAVALFAYTACPAISMTVLNDISAGPTAISADGRIVIGSGWDGGFQWGRGYLQILSDSRWDQYSDISADGQILVGTSLSKAFLWRNGGMFLLPLPVGNSPSTSANAVSWDGSVIVGSMSPASIGTGGPEAAMWSNGGISGLGRLNLDGESVAKDVSADGTVIVGRSHSPESTDEWVPFRWEGGVTTNIGHPKAGIRYTNPNAISADGRLIVGSSEFGYNDERAFVWENGTYTILDHPEPTCVSSTVLDVSGDGAMLVGWSNPGGDWSKAVIWFDDNGYTPKYLDAFLDENGVDRGGFETFEIRAISMDGSTIAGSGYYPSVGLTRTIIVRLTELPSWGNYDILPDGNSVNTGNFIGFIDISKAPWIYVYSLGTYAYMDESYMSESGGWLWISE